VPSLSRQTSLRWKLSSILTGELGGAAVAIGLIGRHTQVCLLTLSYMELQCPEGSCVPDTDAPCFFSLSLTAALGCHHHPLPTDEGQRPPAKSLLCYVPSPCHRNRAPLLMYSFPAGSSVPSRANRSRPLHPLPRVNSCYLIMFASSSGEEQ
jgi:hypothetical protein